MHKALIVATVALGVSLPLSVSGAGTDQTPLTCDGKSAHFHLYRVDRIAAKAFDRSRFLDASPATEDEKRAWKKHKFCLSEKPRKRAETKLDRARSKFDAFYEALLNPPGRGILAAIRSCESGGNYSTATGNGYYGAYQFSLSTWASVGGSGLPSDASPREQDYRAAYLYQRDGAGQWPVCGR